VNYAALFQSAIVKTELRMETRFFRFALIYPVVYIPVFFLLVIPDTGVPVWVNPAAAPRLHGLLFLSSLFCVQNLVLAETGSKCHSTNMRVHFFSCGFFLLGCGLSKPKVNQLYQEKSKTHDAPRLAFPSPDETPKPDRWKPDKGGENL